MAHRPEVGPEPQPVEVLEQRGVVLRPAALAIVVLDAEQHASAGAPGDAPHPDGVGDVAQVEEAGRSGREARQRADERVSAVVPSSRRARSLGLERSGRGHQATVDGEQVGLRDRALVGHRDPEQDLAFPFGVADGAPTNPRLLPADVAGQLGALVQERDELAVEGIDLAPQPAQLGRLGRPLRHPRPRTGAAIASSARW